MLKHLDHHINKIIIHDDCSNLETSNILKSLVNIDDSANTTSNTLNHNRLDPLIESHKIQLIRSEPNIGFAAGVNKASKLATSEYLFILNSDTEILADIITPMLAIIEGDNNIGALNPSGPVF